MEIIKKKTWPEYFELVLAGKKVWFKIGWTEEYTGKKIEKKVD